MTKFLEDLLQDICLLLCELPGITRPTSLGSWIQFVLTFDPVLSSITLMSEFGGTGVISRSPDDHFPLH